MKRTLYSLTLILLATLAYGQKSTLLQNVNFRAKELKHHLNDAGDSLTLESERPIYKVEIFNSSFEKSQIVKNTKVTIPLQDIPVGRFVVEAALPDRLIVITLLRNEIIDTRPAMNIPNPVKNTSLFGNAMPKASERPENPMITPLEDRIVIVNKNNSERRENSSNVNELKSGIASVKETKATVEENSINITKRHTPNTNKVVEAEKNSVLKADAQQNNDAFFFANNNTVAANPGKRVVQAYWIVYKTNNASGSGSIRRFGDQKMVNKMISFINLDKKTIAGKHNELYVYEVYDVDAFVKMKLKNRDYMNVETDCFDSTPYFKAEDREKESSLP